MDTSTWLDQRRAVSNARQRPRQQQCVRFAASSDGSHGPRDSAKPTDVYIEATDPHGETAVWFDDWWWMECLSRWKDDGLAVHILPSPAALLHPVVLHHVEMARRVAPGWRMVGYCWLEEMDFDAAPEAVARSPYHEVRVIDASMPQSAGGREPVQALRVQDFIGAVRRAQRGLGRPLPVLVRLAESPVMSEDRSRQERATADTA